MASCKKVGNGGGGLQPSTTGEYDYSEERCYRDDSSRTLLTLLTRTKRKMLKMENMRMRGDIISPLALSRKEASAASIR